MKIFAIIWLQSVPENVLRMFTEWNDFHHHLLIGPNNNLALSFLNFFGIIILWSMKGIIKKHNFWPNMRSYPLILYNRSIYLLSINTSLNEIRFMNILLQLHLVFEFKRGGWFFNVGCRNISMMSQWNILIDYWTVSNTHTTISALQKAERFIQLHWSFRIQLNLGQTSRHCVRVDISILWTASRWIQLELENKANNSSLDILRCSRNLWITEN